MKKLEKELETIWRARVLERLGYKCIKCGAIKRLNVHHLITRAKKSTRWLILNGVPLCPKHHRLGFDSAHKGGFLFYYWFITTHPELAKTLYEIGTKE
jgi:hypothetical protein